MAYEEGHKEIETAEIAKKVSEQSSHDCHISTEKLGLVDRILGNL